METNFQKFVKAHNDLEYRVGPRRQLLPPVIEIKRALEAFNAYCLVVMQLNDKEKDYIKKREGVKIYDWWYIHDFCAKEGMNCELDIYPHMLYPWH